MTALTYVTHQQVEPEGDVVVSGQRQDAHLLHRDAGLQQVRHDGVVVAVAGEVLQQTSAKVRSYFSVLRTFEDG